VPHTLPDIDAKSAPSSRANTATRWWREEIIETEVYTRTFQAYLRSLR
jgi:hypothetical protein